jgi:hypothetical protein
VYKKKRRWVRGGVGKEGIKEGIFLFTAKSSI